MLLGEVSVHCNHTWHQGADYRRSTKTFMSYVNVLLAYLKSKHISKVIPNVEAVIWVWGVLGPFEQGSFKLYGDLSHRMRW